MKKITLMLAMAALLSGGLALAEEEPMVIPIQRLAMNMAVKAAQATIAACQKEGLSVAVTIIDRGGHTQVTLRDTLAMPITVEISKGKAYAALNFNTPSSGLEGRFTGSIRSTCNRRPDYVSRWTANHCGQHYSRRYRCQWRTIR